MEKLVLDAAINLLQEELEDKIVIKSEIKPLCPATFNFGSNLLHLKFVLNNKALDSQREEESSARSEACENTILDIIGKILPNEETIEKMSTLHLRKIFKNECIVYGKLLPQLIQLQKLYNCNDMLNFYPKFYGGNDDNPLPIILLQNLKPLGYTLTATGDLELSAAKLVLQHLATFHGVSLALKLKKPEEFVNLREQLYSPGEDDDQDVLLKDVTRDVIFNILKDSKLRGRVSQALERQRMQVSENNFACFIHDDCWLANILLKYDQSQNLEDCKIIDYQNVCYGSPARDILMFLYGSARINIVRNQYPQLIEHYHKYFKANLEIFQCYSEEYNLEALQQILQTEGEQSSIFYDLMVLMFALFASKNKKDPQQSEESRFEWGVPKNICEEHIERCLFIIQEFVLKKFI